MPAGVFCDSTPVLAVKREVQGRREIFSEVDFCRMTEKQYPTWVDEYIFTGNWKNSFQCRCCCNTLPLFAFSIFPTCSLFAEKSTYLRDLCDCCKVMHTGYTAQKRATNVSSAGCRLPLYLSSLFNNYSWMSELLAAQKTAKIISWCLLTDPVVRNFTLGLYCTVNFRTRAPRLQWLIVCWHNCWGEVGIWASFWLHFLFMCLS